jgi:hypothetical protein
MTLRHLGMITHAGSGLPAAACAMIDVFRVAAKQVRTMAGVAKAHD